MIIRRIILSFLGITSSLIMIIGVLSLLNWISWIDPLDPLGFMQGKPSQVQTRITPTNETEEIPTVSISPSSTLTVDVNSTATEMVKQTRTARVQLTKNAQATKTQIGIETQRAVVEKIQRISIDQSAIVFGPLSDKLKHDIVYISEYPIGINVKDFILEAAFQNPYSTSIGKWDYGYKFRVTEVSQYWIVFQSDGRWLLSYDSKVSDSEDKNISSGTTTILKTGSDDQNHIRLIVKSQIGYLYLNGEYISELDLSDSIVSGSAAVVSGVFSGDAIPGEQTIFSDLTAWKLETPIYGPYSGDLLVVPNGDFTIYSANVDLRDFEVEAFFSFPEYGISDHWDYGFFFRMDDEGNRLGLFMNSEIDWILYKQNIYGVREYIDSGVLSGFIPSSRMYAGTWNYLKLVCNGDRGDLYVNGDHVSSLDLSSQMNSGDIVLGARNYGFSDLSEKKQSFQDFTVLSLDGNEIYRTDFDTADDLTNWSIFTIPETTEYLSQWENGNYLLAVEPEKYDLYSLNNYYQETKDVHLEVEFKKVKGPDTFSVSLICRATDAGWYELTMNTGGYWFIYLYNDDEFKHIGAGRASNINIGEAVNYMSASCIDNEYSLFINGKEAGSAIDDTFLIGGQVGIGLGSAYPGIGVEFISFSASIP